jgi:hypothetical protein
MRGVSSGPADGEEWATASPTPYAVPALIRETTTLVTTTRRADMGVPLPVGRTGLVLGKEPDATHLDGEETLNPGIWLLCLGLF